jgi:hypothetical protein
MILKRGVDYWDNWRNDNQEKVPDIELSDFSGKGLHGINLCDAKLNRTNL